MSKPKAQSAQQHRQDSPALVPALTRRASQHTRGRLDSCTKLSNNTQLVPCCYKFDVRSDTCCIAEHPTETGSTLIQGEAMGPPEEEVPSRSHQTTPSPVQHDYSALKQRTIRCYSESSVNLFTWITHTHTCTVGNPWDAAEGGRDAATASMRGSSGQLDANCCRQQNAAPQSTATFLAVLI
jgi:hypothetical protein